MFFYTGKVLTALVTPLGFAVAVLIVAMFSLRGIRRLMALLAVAALLSFGSERFSKFLLRTLEKPYAGAAIASAPTVDAIVVLGGYVRVEKSIPRPVELGGAGDRLLCAAELYKAGKAPLILLSGGNISFLTRAGTTPEAVAAQGILEEWGIPASAIAVESASADTHQNGVFSQRLLAQKGLTRILLVTSGFHMRRASGVFRKTGLTVVPFAADLMAEGEPTDLLLSLLPKAEALGDSGLAIKEWLGIAAYRLRNWL